MSNTNEKKNHGFWACFCKALRVITTPALLACMLALFLFLEHREMPFWQFLLFALFDGIIPILSYPVCFFIPKLRAGGRSTQRKAAFIASFAGYSGGAIYAFAARVPRMLLTAYLSYFFSVLVLILIGKVLKLKASGHACGIAGPLTLLVVLLGVKYLPLCLLIAAAVVFSSLYLKRHTLKELLLGALSSVLTVLILWLLLIVWK